MSRRVSTPLAGVLAVLMAVLLTSSSASATSWSVQVASLGDSYASGEGGTETGQYLPGTDTPGNMCHRSQTSPAQLAAMVPWLNMAVDASCSGATTEHITTTSRFEPPQATRLHRGIKKTYTIVGGNDIQFGTLLGCVLQTDCAQTPVPAATQQLLTQLGSKLDQAYTAIRRASAWDAEHVVELYPPILPPTPKPGQVLDLHRCPELSQEEVVIGSQLQQELNRIITVRAKAHGMKVVDPSPAFAAHDVCSPDPWFYRPGMVPQAAVYHPNMSGRAAMAGYMLAA